VFVPGKPFMQGPMFLGKAISGAPLWDRPLALPTNNRLGWKGLPGLNALAYYGRNKFYLQALAVSDEEKMFISTVIWGQCHKTLAVIYHGK
jgi:hypothetical protein